MNNLDGFVIGTLEQMVLALPNEEIRKRFEKMGVPKENIDTFMDCVDNSRKKYEAPKDASGESDK